MDTRVISVDFRAESLRRKADSARREMVAAASTGDMVALELAASRQHEAEMALFRHASGAES